jgi:Ala-tRNA(Pro) deacylase
MPRSNAARGAQAAERRQGGPGREQRAEGEPSVVKTGLARLQQLLDEAGVDYTQIHHRRDYHAAKTALDTFTPPDEFAKTVFVWIDGKPAMAVLPANRHLAPSKLRKALGAKQVRLASETDLKTLCADCEPGAAPPFGVLYDLPVYASRALEADEQITFNGGTHEDAIRMRLADWRKLAQPKMVPLARRE